MKLSELKEKSNRIKNPKPEEIKKFREKLGLTQSTAGGIIYASCRAWQQWEAGDRRMHPAHWELFKIKVSATYGEKD